MLSTTSATQCENQSWLSAGLGLRSLPARTLVRAVQYERRALWPRFAAKVIASKSESA